MPTDDLKLAAPMAEFEALRAEIISLRQVQKNILSIALATLAALFSFAIGKDGDSRLLLVVPPLGLVMCLFQLSETFQINRIGSYIRTKVWPEIMTLTGYQCSWEAQREQRSWVTNSAGALLFDGVVPVLLLGGGITAIVLAPGLTGSAAVWEWACVVLTFLAPAFYGLGFLLHRGKTP